MAIDTALHRNPFFVLGVTVRDDRQRIAAMADERALDLSHDVCSKVRSDLLNPRNRLAAEISWLPGVSPGKAALLIERVATDYPNVISEVGLPTLARANLLAASLEATVSIGAGTLTDIASLLVETASVAGSVDPAIVFRDINEDRSVARFARVATEELVASELAQRHQYYRRVMHDVLDTLPSDQLVAVATEAVSRATAAGEEHAPPMIDELVNLYEVEAQAFLLKESENIERIIAAVRSTAVHGEDGVAPLIDTLAIMARKWDVVAQPIQVGMRARGIEHEMSRTVGGAIRSLAIDLCNEYEMLTQARRLTDLLRDVFAELPEFAERLEEDVDALDSLEASIEEADGKRGEWERSIAYRAEIGRLRKRVLSISTDAVSWRSRTYPIESVTRVRWGGIRQTIGGIPAGAKYTIAFGDHESEAIVEITNDGVYGAFVERLWKTAGVRILLGTLRELQNGKDWWVGDTRIRDDCITLYRDKFWTREPIDVPWGAVRAWSHDGMFNIALATDPSVIATFSFIEIENAHVLDRMVNAAIGKGNFHRLSALLER